MATVNPLHLHSRLRIYRDGIGGALFESINTKMGRSWMHVSRYRVPRFSDMPAIRVELVG